MKFNGTIKLSEIVRVLGVPYREASYVLEQGFVPPGIHPAPSTGNHRLFGPAQAYWLAIVVLLKRSGIQVPRAVYFADRIEEGCRGTFQCLSWDPHFYPWAGLFETDHEHYAEIGDSEWFRICTNSNPSKQNPDVSEWSGLNRRAPVDTEFRPTVVVRLDLSRLAARLKDANWQTE